MTELAPIDFIEAMRQSLKAKLLAKRYSTIRNPYNEDLTIPTGLEDGIFNHTQSYSCRPLILKSFRLCKHSFGETI